MKISFSCIDSVSDPLKWAYRVEEAGFDGLEVISEGKQDIRSEESFKKCVKQIHETTSLTISLHAPLSDLNIASVNEGIWRESVRQIKQCIADAHEFVSDICVVHPGNHSPLSVQMPSDAVLRRQVDALCEICKFASDFGIRIAVENMPQEEMLLGRTPQELLKLVNSVFERGVENIGICLDVGHAFTTGTLQDFLKLLGAPAETAHETAHETVLAKGEKRADEMANEEADEKANDWIVHLHVSDNFGNVDEHLPLGRGSVRWDVVFNALKEFKGIVVTEMLSFDAGVESLRFIRKMMHP